MEILSIVIIVLVCIITYKAYKNTKEDFKLEFNEYDKEYHYYINNVITETGKLQKYGVPTSLIAEFFNDAVAAEVAYEKLNNVVPDDPLLIMNQDGNVGNH